MSELRVRLEGANAKLGEVPAADVANLILVVEIAAKRAAAVALGRPKTTTGRYQGTVEQALDFRLVAIEPGSVVPVLALPPSTDFDDNGQFDLEVASLGQVAVRLLMDAASNIDTHPDPAVAKALLDVADKLHIGERYDAITFEDTANGDLHPARVDGEMRERLRSYVEQNATVAIRPDDLTGVLVEADFEKHTARLRTPTEAGVEVSFTDDQADDIHAALRQQTTARGDVVFDSKTHTAKSVRLTQLVHGEQLILGVDPTEFLAERSLDELAALQDAGRPVNTASLYNAEASEEERDAFMAAISELA